MNRRTLIWHLIVKDLRYQRVLLALVWLLALLLPILARTVSPGRSGGDDFLSSPKALLALICAVIIIRSTQLDPPRRGIHFLAARPVDWFSLFSSKLLFAVAFLLIPYWIATLGPMFAVGMQFDSLDLLLFLIEATITAAAVWSIVAAPALFLRKLASALLTIFGGAVLIGIALAIYLDYLFRAGTLFSSSPADPSYQLEGCRWLIFNIGLACTGMVVALLCYHKRSLKTCLIVLSSGYFLSIALAITWPIDLSVIFSDHSLRVTNLAPALRDKIRFHVDVQPGNPAEIIGDVPDANGAMIETVGLPGRLSGLEAPYFFVQSGGYAEATLRSGRKLTSSYKDVGRHRSLLLDDARLGDNIMQQLASFALIPAEPLTWQEGKFQSFNYFQDRYRNEDLSGVSLKGSVTFTVGRALILASLPLHTGTVLNLQRLRYTVENVKPGANAISFEIVRQYMPLILRGDHFDSLQWENLPWIVINRRKGEYLTPNGGAPLSQNRQNYHLERPGDSKQPIPADWINDAEIVFFSSESCGQISFPYEVPSIDLVH